MKKQLIIITGASSGIGEATAQAFLEKGYPLLLLARRLERLEKFKRDNVLIKKVDVTDLESLKKAIVEAEEKFGPAHCLVNNAGLAHPGLISEQDPKEWKQMFDVNVMGVLNGFHAVLPGMIKRKSGTIINISSVAGKKAFPQFAAYCGTKFAVHAISEGVRQEVAPHNVRVITVAPGVVATEIFDKVHSEKAKKEMSKIQQESGSLGPEAIADSILYVYEQKESTCIREIVITPTSQEL